MKRNLWVVVAVLCLLALMLGAMPAAAQSEVKEKTPMYTYVAMWDIARAQWGDMEKQDAADEAILQKAVSSGTLMGYGSDVNLIHQADGITHDDWWSSSSMAGLLNILEQFYKSGNTMSPVLAGAKKHFDAIYMSKYYNYHPGTYKDVYTHGSSYMLKKDAPEDAVDTLAKTFIVPLMEKMLASGAIHEYEIDTEAIHTENPGTFWIFYIAANAEGLDKVNAGLRDAIKASPLSGPAFDSMISFKEHRDYLMRTTATYK